MTPYGLALIYAALAALPLAMHIALVFGAPLGRFTLGGRYSGRPTPLWRWAAMAQGLLLLGMATTVLDFGGVLALDLPDALFWGTFALSCVTALLNVISPSRPERLLWGPVTGLMALSAGALIFLIKTGGVL